MTDKDLLADINKIFIDVLDNDSIVLTENSSADDIEEWDSLNHIQLVVAIERQFHIKFTAAEIQKWRDVGDMCVSIQAKLHSGN